MRAFVLGNYINANFLVVDRLPQEGESLAATSYRQEHGGKGLNLAMALKRLGVEVNLMMAVGPDLAGEAVTQRVAAEGIDTAGVLTLGAASGFGVGFIAPDGRNFLAVHLGANALLTPDHVQAARGALAEADWVLAHFEIPETVSLEAFRMARRQGKQTYLNPSPWHAPDPELMALTDVLVVNATEAALMFDQPNLADLSRDGWTTRLPALASGAQWRGTLLVVTLADAGCVALDGAGRAMSHPAYPIRQVDATGSGDAFGSGLVWSLMCRQALFEALRVANACGALLAAREGVLDNLPTRARVEEFMASDRRD